LHKEKSYKGQKVEKIVTKYPNKKWSPLSLHKLLTKFIKPVLWIENY